MANNTFSGFECVNGTADDFDVTKLTDKSKAYFVRTDKNKENGYIYFNGKKYGVDERIINCGEY